METKGIVYHINHDGVEYKAIRTGSLFYCNGAAGTLKEIKTMIQEGDVPREVDSQPVQSVDSQPVQSVTPADIDVGLWSCIHPCALLVLTVGDRALDDDMRKEFITTLDNYGWLTEKGSPDYRRAMHEYKTNALGGNGNDV